MTSGLSPVMLAVGDRATHLAWVPHLDAAGIDHSPALVAIQVWLVLENPDRRHLRSYNRTTRGPELKLDKVSPWLTPR